MKQTTLGIAISSLLLASSMAVANVEDNRLNPDRSPLVQSAAERAQGQAAFGSYVVLERGVSAQNQTSPVVRPGLEVINQVTRRTGEVSDRITVMVSDGNLAELANRLGLELEYSAGRGIGQLRVPADADMLELLAEIEGAEGVRAARIEVLEERYQLDVISR